jgi:hypothetical protein
MDAAQFDALTRTLHARTQRRFVGLGVATLAAALGLDRAHEASARKCKKKCGPCKRCKKGKGKKGKCKPKPAGTVCAGGTCQGGACLPFCAGKNVCVDPAFCQASGADCFCLVRADAGHEGEPFCGQLGFVAADCSVCTGEAVCVDGTGPLCGGTFGCHLPCLNPL